jgi:hypothetical protein
LEYLVLASAFLLPFFSSLYFLQKSFSLFKSSLLKWFSWLTCIPGGEINLAAARLSTLATILFLNPSLGVSSHPFVLHNLSLYLKAGDVDVIFVARPED